MKRFDLVADGDPFVVEAGPGLRAIDGRQCEVDVADLGRGSRSVIVDGIQRTVHVVAAGQGSYEVAVSGSLVAVHVRDPRTLRSRAAAGVSGPQDVRAPMPGRILAVHVCAGERVERGQALLVIEAMKMQNEIRSPREGTVRSVGAAAGSSVSAGDALVVIE